MSQKLHVYQNFLKLHILCKILTTFMPLLKIFLQGSYFPVLLLSKPAVYMVGWFPAYTIQCSATWLCLRMILLNRWSYHTLTPGIWRPPGYCVIQDHHISPTIIKYVHMYVRRCQQWTAAKESYLWAFIQIYPTLLSICVCCRKACLDNRLAIYCSQRL